MAVKPAQLLVSIALGLTIPRLNEARHAHSFQHFHGPVYGEDSPVVWSDEHGKQHEDYAAPAHYEFAYGVEDHQTGDYHGQKEQRDGKAVAGEYTVKEPDGNVRTVKYHADEDGFHATVHNSHRRGNQGSTEHRQTPPASSYYDVASVNSVAADDDDDDDNDDDDES